MNDVFLMKVLNTAGGIDKLLWKKLGMVRIVTMRSNAQDSADPLQGNNYNICKYIRHDSDYDANDELREITTLHPWGNLYR